MVCRLLFEWTQRTQVHGATLGVTQRLRGSRRVKRGGRQKGKQSSEHSTVAVSTHYTSLSNFPCLFLLSLLSCIGRSAVPLRSRFSLNDGCGAGRQHNSKEGETTPSTQQGFSAPHSPLPCSAPAPLATGVHSPFLGLGCLALPRWSVRGFAAVPLVASSNSEGASGTGHTRRRGEGMLARDGRPCPSAASARWQEARC
jgi:hypothetical protein